MYKAVVIDDEQDGIKVLKQFLKNTIQFTDLEKEGVLAGTRVILILQIHQNK